MNNHLKFGLSVFVSLLSSSAYGQLSKYPKLHGASISVGATGNYTETLSDNPVSGTYSVPASGGGVLRETVSNQKQYITSSVGFLTSIQFHPVAWAGVELNYGYQHYSEGYSFNYSSSSATQAVRIPTTTHEATAAYGFHPRHIPLQPFVNMGGGAIDFLPTGGGPNQWRGAGLLEAGFDVPLPGKHLALRAEGRGLFYRAPNYNSSLISSRSWRVSAEPSASFVYRF